MKYILHVVGCLELGGTEAFIMNIYRNIDRTKFQFDFLVLNEKEYPYTKEIKELGGEIFFGYYPKKKDIFKFVQDCASVMKNKKYSAVHSHLNVFNAWLMLAAKKAGVQIRVSHSHDMFGLEGNLLNRAFHKLEQFIIKKNANEFLACSEGAGAYLYGESYFKKNGIIVNNGIDVEKFLRKTDDHTELRKEFNINHRDGLVFGNITRFEPKKNQMFLIDVFNAVLKLRPDSFLLLGGVDGGQLSECVQKVKDLNIEDKVRFIGPRNDVPDVLGLTDVYLFPSMYEGLGIVLLEAQAAGCYCVASTACPTESDMGLDSIVYLSLNETAEKWANEIVHRYYEFKEKPLDNDTIVKAFEKKKYSKKQLVETITQIYSR